MYVEWYGVCNFVVFRLLRHVLTMVVCMLVLVNSKYVILINMIFENSQ